MLQKVDKDRLDKVLEVIKAKAIRKPNATLMREIPEKKSNVSAYLNGVKPMSDNFYRTFMAKFGDEDAGGAEQNKEMNLAVQDLHENSSSFQSLLANNKLLGEAFLKQASAHEKEAEARILQAQANKASADLNMEMYRELSSGNGLKNSQVPALDLDKVSKFLAKKYSLNSQDVAVELGKFALEGVLASKVPGNKDGADKLSKQDP